MHELAMLLTSLGLTTLEADVYRLLVGYDALTGYRIGQLLNKPTANVYKALEALAVKGAVFIEEGDARTCGAVPPTEFLRHLETSYLQSIRRPKISSP